jgi:glycosyltransferase involved in cell wall biosynthesis
VIVTVYNKAPFVQESLESVLHQTYENVELVVVDDGSTDESAAVVARALAGSGAAIVTLVNGGVSRARNVGAEHASAEAEYLLFLDGDDVLDADALQTLVDQLERHHEAVACYSRLRLVDAEGRPLADPPADVRWSRTRFGRLAVPEDVADTPLDAVWSRYEAIPSSCLMRRSAFARTDGWDSGLCRPARPFGAEDKDMVIQLTLLGQLHRLPAALLDYRVMPSPNRDALYVGLAALNGKWWSADLPPATRRRVRRAIWFDARVVLLDAIGVLAQTLRARQPTGMATASMGVARTSVRWATTGLRTAHAARAWRAGGFTRGPDTLTS